MITIDEFKKGEIRIGIILSAEKVPDTDKLLKLSVNFGESAPRQIISGIALFVPDPQMLVGLHCPFATNLEPRVIRGLESNGMILAVGGRDDIPFSLLTAGAEIPAGTRVS